MAAAMNSSTDSIPPCRDPNRLEVRRKGLLADFFMTGVNAVTLGGSLYWVDMVGNRTAPVIFGPRRVVLLAGRNKIVDTQADAERRVQQIAGPKNVARHTGFRTPCAVTGLCADCNRRSASATRAYGSNGVIPLDEFSCC